MFKSTGSYFGAPEITFKDYQDEHKIVLNAAFEFSADSDAFRNANVLEIYVPNLSLNKSAVTSCFFAAQGAYAWMGTVAKCWIKDKNTICVEKLDIWDNLPNRKIWIFSLFGLRGFHDLVAEVTTPTYGYLQQSQSMGSISDTYYYEDEHFIFLGFQVRELGFNIRTIHDEVTNYTPFPEDINTVVPFVACMVDYRQPGVAIMEVPFREQKLIFENFPQNMTYGTGYSPFFYAWIVRGNGTDEDPDAGSLDE